MNLTNEQALNNLNSAARKAELNYDAHVLIQISFQTLKDFLTKDEKKEVK